MKKAKVILSLLAILAIVATAVAFKAARVNTIIAFTTSGLTVTSFTTNGFVYTTTVNACTRITGRFLTTTQPVQGQATTVGNFVDVTAITTGFNNGVSTTWTELLCLPQTIAVSYYTTSAS